MNSTTIPAREQLAKLAEALYRFSSSLDSTFSVHLKQIAVELAGALEMGDEAAIAGTLTRARGIVSLGERVNAIAASDVKVIAAAIERSESLTLPVPAKESASVAVFAEIAATSGSAPTEQVAEKADAPVQVAQPAANPAPVAGPANQPHAVPVAEKRQEPVAAVSLPMNSAADRQERIVAAIRQNPNARMRDLLAALPGVSERTIRYDLERLVTSGTIEREGVGGPATWYRVRAGVTR